MDFKKKFGRGGDESCGKAFGLHAQWHHFQGLPQQTLNLELQPGVLTSTLCHEDAWDSMNLPYW
jgi:hypothetical protein